MERNLLVHVLCVILVCVGFGCSKDDVSDPSGTVMLNMLNEKSGGTRLGTSDIYINEANNFYTRSCYIADCGNTGGVGKRIGPVTNNLVREVAVAQDHMYQAFDEETIMTFPSGVNAVFLNSTYYRFYVVEPLKTDASKAGSVVKYVSVQAEADDLPEYNKVVAEFLNYTVDPVSIDLPKGAEYTFDTKFDKLFSHSVKRNTLTLSLVNDGYEHTGDYNLYIRQGQIFTRVILRVKKY